MHVTVPMHAIPIGVRRGYWIPWKHRLKPLWDFVLLHSVWLRSRQQTMANAGEDMVKRETLTHRWWQCKLVQLLWKPVWQFLKKLELHLPRDPAIPIGYKPQRLYTLLQKYLLIKHVHCCPFYDIQKLETTQTSISWWMDNEGALHIHKVNLKFKTIKEL